MNEPLETIEYRGHTIEVHLDPNADSPREWDNLGTMICFHSRYNLGDEHHFDHRCHNNWYDLQTAVMKVHDPCVMLPVFLYDHGGLRIKVGSFQGHLPQGHAEFDSGQVGWILCSKETARKEYSKHRLSKKVLEKVAGVLTSEVDTYDQYLSGQVYGFIIKDHEGERLDSCWGYYGQSYMIEECISMIDYMAERNAQKGIQECIDNRRISFENYIEQIEQTWGIDLGVAF